MGVGVKGQEWLVRRPKPAKKRRVSGGPVTKNKRYAWERMGERVGVGAERGAVSLVVHNPGFRGPRLSEEGIGVTSMYVKTGMVCARVEGRCGVRPQTVKGHTERVGGVVRGALTEGQRERRESVVIHGMVVGSQWIEGCYVTERRGRVGEGYASVGPSGSVSDASRVGCVSAVDGVRLQLAMALMSRESTLAPKVSEAPVSVE